MAIKSVLVAGGAGFIGSYVVELLLSKGYDVKVYDKLVEQVHANRGAQYLSKDAELIIGDMVDATKLATALDGVDAVINLAAEVGVGQSMKEIQRYVSANTLGTAVLLDQLASGRFNVQRMVVASSMSVYGEGAYQCKKHGTFNPKNRSTEQLNNHDWDYHCPVCQVKLETIPTAETKLLQPSSIYAVSKLDQEVMSLLVGKTYGIGTIALRFFNTYGPRQALSNPYTGVGAIFTNKLLMYEAPIIYEDGRQIRDFIHVSDTASAVVKALEAEHVSGVICNVGTGKPIRIEEVAHILARELKKDIAPIITQNYRAGDIRHCWADVTRAESLIGFRAKMDLEDGLRDLVNWVIATDPKLLTL